MERDAFVRYFASNGVAKEPPIVGLPAAHHQVDVSEQLQMFGNLVIARDGAIERVLVLDGPLTIDADFDARSASGELPFGEMVRVEMNGQHCNAETFVHDADDGAEDGSGQVMTLGAERRPLR